ncbi:MAG: hypothetical protein ACRD0J_09490 [Acidimicrobiales bacterium]
MPTITTAAEHRLIQWLPGTTVRLVLDGPATGGQLFGAAGWDLREPLPTGWALTAAAVAAAAFRVGHEVTRPTHPPPSTPNGCPPVECTATARRADLPPGRAPMAGSDLR